MEQPDLDLRLLTVKQPWAWGIIHGGKDVENRTWKFPLPLGTTIALHAGGKWDSAVWRSRPDATPPKRDEFTHNAVIGFVDVVADHGWEECDRAEGITGVRFCSPWAAPEHRHWRLANPRPIDPVTARGRLWLHRPEPEVKSQLLEALAREQGTTAG